MKLTRKSLRNLILKEMYHSSRDAAFDRAQAKYDAMTPDYDDSEPPSASASEEEVIDTLIENEFLEQLIEEIAEDDNTPHIMWVEQSQSYVDKNGVVLARYIKVPGPSGRIYDDLEMVNEDAAEDIVRDYLLNVGISDYYYDAFDEIVNNLRSSGY